MLWKLLVEYLRPQRRLLIAVVIFQLAQSIASLYLPTLNADIIDEGVAKGDTGYILRLGSVMLVITLLQIGCAVVAVYFGAKAAMALGRDLRGAVFTRVGEFSEQEVTRFGAPSLASDARVLRPGVEPRTGGAARELVAGEGGAPSTTGGAGVSRSGDLGYTWGTRSRTTPQGVQDGHYVRVWRRDGVEWRAVADVVVAPPPAASGN